MIRRAADRACGRVGSFSSPAWSADQVPSCSTMRSRPPNCPVYRAVVLQRRSAVAIGNCLQLPELRTTRRIRESNVQSLATAHLFLASISEIAERHNALIKKRFLQATALHPMCTRAPVGQDCASGRSRTSDFIFKLLVRLHMRAIRKLQHTTGPAGSPAAFRNTDPRHPVPQLCSASRQLTGRSHVGLSQERGK
jgi:hypothetical protein